jgi:hypothetical protein
VRAFWVVKHLIRCYPKPTSWFRVEEVRRGEQISQPLMSTVQARYIPIPAPKQRHEAARWMARLGRRRRARQAAICLGEAQAAVEPRIPEWEFLPQGKTLWHPGNPGNRGVPEGNPPNGNILVGGGRETNRDSLSRGDRKGRSSNQISAGKPQRDVGLRLPIEDGPDPR